MTELKEQEIRDMLKKMSKEDHVLLIRLLRALAERPDEEEQTETH